MALIVEDGSLLQGANSFVSVAEVRAFANARASILPASDTEVEVAAVKAADYVRSLRSRFKGSEIIAEQPLPFPRCNLVVNGFDLPSNTVPQGIKDACCQLALEAAAGVDLLPTTSGQITVVENVGPLETSFAPNSAPDGSQFFAAARALLTPYMKGSSSGGLSTCRT